MGVSVTVAQLSGGRLAGAAVAVGATGGSGRRTRVHSRRSRRRGGRGGRIRSGQALGPEYLSVLESGERLWAREEHCRLELSACWLGVAVSCATATAGAGAVVGAACAAGAVVGGISGRDSGFRAFAARDCQDCHRDERNDCEACEPDIQSASEQVSASRSQRMIG